VGTGEMAAPGAVIETPMCPSGAGPFEDHVKEIPSAFAADTGERIDPPSEIESCGGVWLCVWGEGGLDQHI
jgi:hypothetical protein